MIKLSRRQLAKYFVQKTQAGASAKPLLRELAAHLIDTKRVKEVDLLVSDINVEFERSGTVQATVISANPLSEKIEHKIESVLKSTNVKQVNINKQIDDSLLGGLIIQTPEREFDLSIRSKLNRMKV